MPGKRLTPRTITSSLSSNTFLDCPGIESSANAPHPHPNIMVVVITAVTINEIFLISDTPNLHVGNISIVQGPEVVKGDIPGSCTGSR